MTVASDDGGRSRAFSGPRFQAQYHIIDAIDMLVVMFMSVRSLKQHSAIGTARYVRVEK